MHDRSREVTARGIAPSALRQRVSMEKHAYKCRGANVSLQEGGSCLKAHTYPMYAPLYACHSCVYTIRQCTCALPPYTIQSYGVFPRYSATERSYLNGETQLHLWKVTAKRSLLLRCVAAETSLRRAVYERFQIARVVHKREMTKEYKIR